MLKRFALFLLATLILTVTACSNNSSYGSASSSSGGSGNQPIALEFWDMVWGPDEYIETAKKLVDQFNSENPGIKVQYQSIPWTNWYQRFTTSLASGTAPDISTGGAYQAFQFFDNDNILPIDDVIEEWRKEGKLDDFNPGYIEFMKYKDHYVALPWGIDIRIWVYRKDLFEKANVAVPANWQEIRDAAKKLTGGGVYGFVASGDLTGSEYVPTLMLNNGGGIFTENKEVDMLNERNMEAAQFIADLVKDGSVNPASGGFKDADMDKSFIQGNAAIMMQTPGFVDSYPDLRDKIGVMDPPAGPHGEKATLDWVNNIMIYKQTKHPKEAKQFLKWWSENSKALFVEGHSSQIPARTSIAQDDYYQKDELRKTIIDNYLPIAKRLSYKYPSPFPLLNEIEGEGALYTLIQMLLSGKSVDEAMKMADSGLKEIMAKESP